MFDIKVLSKTDTEPSGFNKGDMITVISSVFYAMHITVIGFLVKRMNPIILTFLQTITAGIIGLAISLAMEPLPTDFSIAGIFSILYFDNILYCNSIRAVNCMSEVCI